VENNIKKLQTCFLEEREEKDLLLMNWFLDTLRTMDF
jgi:hypothetical protein